MHKTPPQPTSIRQLLQYYNADRLNFYPEYQRESERWDARRKKDLLFSLINSTEYVIPNLYLHSNSPKGRQLEVFDVVDGKQRLSTIINFVTGRKIRRKDGVEEPYYPIRIGDDYPVEILLHHQEVMKPLLGKSFSELDETEQDLFLDVRLNVVFMVDYDKDVLRNVFQFMQSGRNLTPQEKVLSLNSPIIQKSRELYHVYGDGLTKYKRSNQNGLWIHGISELILVTINPDVNLAAKDTGRLASIRYKEEVIEAARDKVSAFLLYMTSVMDESKLGHSDFIRTYTVRFFTVLLALWNRQGDFMTTPGRFGENWEKLAPKLPDMLMTAQISASELSRPGGREAYMRFIKEEMGDIIERF